jgi:hypothetical protein
MACFHVSRIFDLKYRKKEVFSLLGWVASYGAIPAHKPHSVAVGGRFFASLVIARSPMLY